MLGWLTCFYECRFVLHILTNSYKFPCRLFKIFYLENCFSGTENVLHLIQANNLTLKENFLPFIIFLQYSRNFYVTMAVQKWSTTKCCGIKPPFILHNRMTFNAPSLCGLHLLCLHFLGILLGQSWYPNNLISKKMFGNTFFLWVFRVLVKNQEILSPKYNT